MITLSIDALTGFSTAPLRVATFAGFGGALIAVLLVGYTLIAQFSGHTVAGWTSTVAIVSGFGAIQLLCVGILGEYIGRMYTHLQGRPAYFIAYDSLPDSLPNSLPDSLPDERADRRGPLAGGSAPTRAGRGPNEQADAGQVLHG